MKKLLLILPIALLAHTVQAQDFAIATSTVSPAATSVEKAPVESYWLNETIEPLNYSSVLQSISYDARALEAGLEGTVLLLVEVDEHGHYFDHEVLEDGHPILLEAVENKAHLLEFPAPEYEGEPTSALVVVPFRFRLTDGW